jgi:hypothetical protein
MALVREFFTVNFRHRHGENSTFSSDPTGGRTLLRRLTVQSRAQGVLVIEVSFQTKPQLAKAMFQRALEWGVPVSWTGVSQAGTPAPLPRGRRVWGWWRLLPSKMPPQGDDGQT